MKRVEHLLHVGHALVAWQYPATGDRPAPIAHSAELIRIGSQMCTMEATDADMDDPRPQRSTVVGGDGNARVKRLEGGLRELGSCLATFISRHVHHPVPT